MAKLPTDLQILDTIFKYYYDEFATYREEVPTRITKNFVPLDIEKIARHLGTDSEIVFGRLYQHLEKIYGYEKKDGVKMHFFALSLGEGAKREIHAINFPYMCSVLAQLRHENNKYRLTFIVSLISLAIAILSLVLSVVGLKK